MVEDLSNAGQELKELKAYVKKWNPHRFCKHFKYNGGTCFGDKSKGDFKEACSDFMCLTEESYE